MVFNYKGVDASGLPKEGVIEALNIDIAISSLQRRGLTLASITPQGQGSLLNMKFGFFEHVAIKDVVILSRQISTLFHAQVSALRAFRLLADETTNHRLGEILTVVADDLQGGSSIYKALAKHPKVFSDFYINMVRSGEESGKLAEVLEYLADYLDRSYRLISKARNALVYPAFIMFTFVVVMTLMLTVVIPNITKIIEESGQEIPVYTKAVIMLSTILTHYGIFILIGLIIVGFFFIKFIRTPDGRMSFDRFRQKIPYVGLLYRRLYWARIADNLNTMLISAIPIVRALEVTAAVVGSAVYEQVLKQVLQAVQSGSTLSDAFAKHPELPGIMIQMTKVGEETGELGDILKNLSSFYSREVENAVDTLVGLIEPTMIVSLAVGVAILLASVLVPIYNISAGA